MDRTESLGEVDLKKKEGILRRSTTTKIQAYVLYETKQAYEHTRFSETHEEETMNTKKKKNTHNTKIEREIYTY